MFADSTSKSHKKKRRKTHTLEGVGVMKRNQQFCINNTSIIISFVLSGLNIESGFIRCTLFKSGAMSLRYSNYLLQFRFLFSHH